MEELGETEDGVLATTSELQALVKGLTGFDILESDQKTFKSIYDIMVGIGEQWDKLSDIEQASLSEKLFGKRNSNIGFSVLQNIDTLKSVYKTAEESEGSALREQENYNRSIEAHINQAKASLQELLYKAIDSGLVKDLLDAGKGVLDFLTAIIDKVGLLNTLLPITAGILGAKNNGAILGFADTIKKSFAEVGNIITAVKAASPREMFRIFKGGSKNLIGELKEGLSGKYTVSDELAVAMNAYKGSGTGADFIKDENYAGVINNLDDATKSLIGTMDKGSFSVENLSEKLKATSSPVARLGTAFKTLGASIKAAFMSVAIIAAIELIISAVTDLYDALTISSEEAEEMAEKFGTNYEKYTSDMTDNSKSISELNDEYQKLSKGVSESGENISLTSDQYDRYKEIIGQLSSMMPNMATYFNAQGEAIGFVNQNMSDLNKTYREYIQTQARMNLNEKDEDGHYLREGVLKDFYNKNVAHEVTVSNDVAGLLPEKRNSTYASESSYLQNILQSNKSIVDYLHDTSNNDYKFLEKILEEKNVDKKDVAESLEKNKTELEKIVNNGDEDSEYYKTVQGEIDEQEQEIRTALSDYYKTVSSQAQTSYTPIKELMNTIVLSNETYTQATEEQREQINSFINSIDAEDYEKLGFGKDYDKVYDFVTNYINGSLDTSSEIYRVMNDISNLSQTSKVGDIEKNKEKYIAELKNIFKFTDDAQAEALLALQGIDTKGIDKGREILQKKLNALNTSTDVNKWIDSLTPDELKIASTDEYAKALNRVEAASGDGVISIRELNSALYTMKNASDSAAKSTQSLADINKTRNSLEGLYDKFNQNGYLDQKDVASILEENPEYYKYIVKVGDQYKLNVQSFKEWADSVNTQQSKIDSMLGGFGYIGELQSGLDDIKNSNLSNKQEDIDFYNELVQQNKQLNDQMINGEITSSQYMEGLKNQISGLNNKLKETNGEFNMSTDYLEQMTGFQLNELASGMTQVFDQYLNGLISTKDLLLSMKSTLEASAGAYNSLYGVELSEKQYGYNTIDKPTEIQNEAVGIDIKVNNADIKSAEKDLDSLKNTAKKDGDIISDVFDKLWGSSKNSSKKSTEETENDIENIKDTAVKNMESINKIDSVLPFAESFEEYNEMLKQAEIDTGAFDFSNVDLNSENFTNFFNDILAGWDSFIEKSQQGTQTLYDNLMQINGMTEEQANYLIEKVSAGEYAVVQETLTNMGVSAQAMSLLVASAMTETSTAISNSSQAIGSVLSALGDAISSFDYTLKVEGGDGIAVKFDVLGLGLPVTLGNIIADGSVKITGSGGSGISYGSTQGDGGGLANALKGAGGYFTQAGNMAALRAMSTDSYAPAGTSDYARPMSAGGSSDSSSGGSGGGGGSDSGGGGGSDNDSCTKAEEKNDSCTTIDHIETKLKRLDEELDKVAKAAERTYTIWDKRNDKLNEQEGILACTETRTQAARDAYAQKACSIPLDADHKRLVRDGCTYIETFADDNLKKLIDEYQEWYEKMRDCEAKLEDLKDQQAELKKQKFDNIVSQYDQLIERVDSANKKLELWQEHQENRGLLLANDFNEQKIINEQRRQKTLREEYVALRLQLDDAVNSGRIEVTSQKWFEMNNDLMELDNTIQESINAVDDATNAIRDNTNAIFDRKMEWKRKVADESDFLIDTLSRDTLYNETGMFTNSGLATLGLRGIEYNYYAKELQDYKKELARLEEEARQLDHVDVNLVERQQELREKMQDATKSMLDQKDAIKDLVKEGYNTLVNYLNKLIDKYKESLNAQKNLYDYEKNIRNQTKAITDYRKQLMALEGDDSEENKARLQQLRENLRNAEEELESTEYDKWLEDQQSILDDMMSDLEEWIEKKLERTDEIMEEQISAINGNTDTISKTINDKVDDLGYVMSDETDKLVNNTCSNIAMVSDYHGDFLTPLNRISDYMESVDEKFDKMLEYSRLDARADLDVQGSPNNGVANNGCSSSNQDAPWAGEWQFNQSENSGCTSQQQNNTCTSQQNNGCTSQQQNNTCTSQQNNGCTSQQQNNGCTSQQPNNACTSQQQNNGCTTEQAETADKFSRKEDAQNESLDSIESLMRRYNDALEAQKQLDEMIASESKNRDNAFDRDFNDRQYAISNDLKRIIQAIEELLGKDFVGEDGSINSAYMQAFTDITDAIEKVEKKVAETKEELEKEKEEREKEKEEEGGGEEEGEESEEEEETPRKKELGKSEVVSGEYYTGKSDLVDYYTKTQQDGGLTKTYMYKVYSDGTVVKTLTDVAGSTEDGEYISGHAKIGTSGAERKNIVSNSSSNTNASSAKPQKATNNNVSATTTTTTTTTAPTATPNNGCTNSGATTTTTTTTTSNSSCTTNNNSCSNYATGRQYGDREIAWTQENGREVIYRKSDGAFLTPLGKGDKVFTNAQTEALWSLSKDITAFNMPGVPTAINTAISSGDSNVTFAGDINVVGVNNPQEFSQQLRDAINNDVKVKQTLQANTLGVAMGRSSFLGNTIK